MIKKTAFLPIAVILIMSIIVYYLFDIENLLRTSKTPFHANAADFSTEYDAQTEIQVALEKYHINGPRASVVVSNPVATTKQIAITFDGLNDPAVMQRILNMLNKNKMKATFFVDGVQAGEESQILINIKKAGHSIQNYTLVGTRRMERLAPDKLIANFSQAQKIIQIVSGTSPTLLKCNDTTYSTEVLLAAKAAGLDSVVESKLKISPSDLSSPALADILVSKLENGSIVSIDLLPFPETVQYEPIVVDEPPAVDKRPGLKTLPPSPTDSKINIITAIENLLVALSKANYQTVLVETMPKMIPNSISLPQKSPEQSGQVPTPIPSQPVVKNTAKKNLSVTNLLNLATRELCRLFETKTAYASSDKLATEFKSIPTTEQAVAFTFGGLTRKDSVYRTLEQLDTMGIKGTFFIFEVEMQRFPDIVHAIIERGHEIGIAINQPKTGADGYQQTRQNILSAQTMLKNKFGITTNFIKQPWGEISDDSKRAIASLNYTLIGQSINIIQTKHKDTSSVSQIIQETFGKYRYSLGRGQIIYFRMDYYTNPEVLHELITAIKKQKIDNIAFNVSYDNPTINPRNDSTYTIKPIGEILANTKYLYTYPVPLDKVPESIREPRPLPSLQTKSVVSEFSKRYIGNQIVDYEDRTFGFSRVDDRRLDKSGVINTNDNVIFLTFDDWGTDASINKLLYVLRKHNTTASFFIITRTVSENKNLLRAIAEGGHEIGSHSNLHIPMAIRDTKTNKQYDGQTHDERYADVLGSYTTLRDVVGDVVVNNKPAMVRIFRPPTLAVSKIGAEAIFSAGFDFIVNGFSSTADYKAQSITELVRAMKSGIYNEKGELIKGTILVMHMSDNSLYTAMAVDILLTANAAKLDSDPTKFKVGRLADYLVEDYDQMKPVPAKKRN